jgi:hypothetical protein
VREMKEDPSDPVTPPPFAVVSSLHKFSSQYSQHNLGILVPRLGCDFLAL